MNIVLVWSGYSRINHVTFSSHNLCCTLTYIYYRKPCQRYESFNCEAIVIKTKFYNLIIISLACIKDCYRNLQLQCVKWLYRLGNFKPFKLFFIYKSNVYIFKNVLRKFEMDPANSFGDKGVLAIGSQNIKRVFIETLLSESVRKIFLKRLD